MIHAIVKHLTAHGVSCAWRYARKELLMLITYTAIFADGEDGWIVGWVRELSGAIVQERTIEEARQSLQEVIPQILATRDANDKEYTIIAREPDYSRYMNR